jgi:hypothetical protein
MITMRVTLGLIVFLVGLVILTPFAYASTFEAWTDGLYDAESDDSDQAVRSVQVVETRPLTSLGGIDVVVAVLSHGNESGTDLTVTSTRSARAPPAS